MYKSPGQRIVNKKTVAGCLVSEELELKDTRRSTGRYRWYRCSRPGQRDPTPYSGSTVQEAIQRLKVAFPGRGVTQLWRDL